MLFEDVRMGAPHGMFGEGADDGNVGKKSLCEPPLSHSPSVSHTLMEKSPVSTGFESELSRQFGEMIKRSSFDMDFSANSSEGAPVVLTIEGNKNSEQITSDSHVPPVSLQVFVPMNSTKEFHEKKTLQPSQKNGGS